MQVLLCAQHRVLKNMLEATQTQCAAREADIVRLQGIVAQQEVAIAQAEAKARADEIIRHDTLSYLHV